MVSTFRLLWGWEGYCVLEYFSKGHVDILVTVVFFSIILKSSFDNMYIECWLQKINAIMKLLHVSCCFYLICTFGKSCS